MERRDGRVIIDADADIKVPETSNTPILELAQTELTQQRLTELVRHFAGTKKLYKSPVPTKSELEAELTQIKNRGGDYGAPYWDSFIFGVQTRAMEMIELAPETAKLEYVDIGFSRPEQDIFNYILYDADEDIEKYTAETEFHAKIEDTNDSLEASVNAARYDETNGTSSHFSYQRGYVYAADDYKKDKDAAEQFSSWVGTDLELLGKINEDWLKEKQDWLTEFEGLTENVSLDQKWAQEQAEQALSDLGIEDMGLAEVNTGVQIAETKPGLLLGTAIYDLSTAKSGYEFIYFRMLDGIPACLVNNGSIHVGTMENKPAAPAFYPEYISVFVTKEGVQSFTWENMAHVVGSVAENTKLLSFDEIKEKFADMINFYTMPDEETRYRNEVYNVELRAGYMPAYGNPAHAWLVPAWFFEYDQYQSSNEDELENPGIQFQMSAVDGGYIPAAGGSIGYD